MLNAEFVESIKSLAEKAAKPEVVSIEDNKRL